MKYSNIASESGNGFILPVKTHEAIARDYDINVRTLRRLCKREGLDLPSRPLSPRYQQLIYETFGIPPIR